MFKNFEQLIIFGIIILVLLHQYQRNKCKKSNFPNSSNSPKNVNCPPKPTPNSSVSCCNTKTGECDQRVLSQCESPLTVKKDCTSCVAEPPITEDNVYCCDTSTSPPTCSSVTSQKCTGTNKKPILNCSDCVPSGKADRNLACCDLLTGNSQPLVDMSTCLGATKQIIYSDGNNTQDCLKKTTINCWDRTKGGCKSIEMKPGACSDEGQVSVAACDINCMEKSRRRPFRLALYHGGFSEGMNNDSEVYNRYVTEMANWANSKDFDDVYIDVSGINTFGFEGTDDGNEGANMSTFLLALNNANPCITAGAVLEVAPKYEFDAGLGNYEPGGTNCFDKKIPICDCPPGPLWPPGCEPTTKQAADKKYKNCWKEPFSTDNCPKAPTWPPGCPNTIERSFYLLANANKAAKEKKSNVFFTSFIGDNENAGFSSSLICNYIIAAKKYILPSLPDPYRGLNGQDRAKLFTFGFAHGVGEHTAASLTGFTQNCMKFTNDAAQCLETIKIANLVSFPEVYWNLAQIKEQGCIGCDQTINNQNLSAKTYDDCVDSVSKKSCSKIEGCSNYKNLYLDSTNFEQYAKCVDSSNKSDGCPIDCCKCQGCIPCKFTKDGKSPNPAISYQRYVNKPNEMANVVSNSLVGYLPNMRSPQTYAMFSNELSHDWTIPKQSSGQANEEYNVYGNTGTNKEKTDGSGFNGYNTCVRRAYGEGENTCGTFSGFSTWTWEDFEAYMKSFYQNTKVDSIALYEYQFVQPHWK